MDFIKGNSLKDNTIGNNNVVAGGDYNNTTNIDNSVYIAAHYNNTTNNIINSLENYFCPPYTEEEIKESYKNFVPTSQFKKAAEILCTKNAVVLVGFSGIGKTCASEILADSFVKKGYQLKYLSNISLDTLERFLCYLNNNIKQLDIIIFDDFLGSSQMNKEYRYIEKMEEFFKNIATRYKNKKFIFNSRKTLIQDVKIKNWGFSDMLEKKLSIIDFECWDNLEDKIEIFELYCRKNNIIDQIKTIISNEMWSSDICDKIFKHHNFSPLIIERAIADCKDRDISEYAEIIIKYLDNPKYVWEKEISVLNENSRYYLLTLYSLTDWLVDKEKVDECYKNIHVSNECLEDVILRLELLLKKQGNKIGFIHPSLLEYFKSKISPEDEKMIFGHITYFEQMERMDCSKESIKALFDLPEDALIEKFKKLKVLPVNFKLNDGDIIGFENCIWIKYLKYMYDLKIEDCKHQDILIETLNDILGHNPGYFLFHSARDILNVFSLNYNFTEIIENKGYLEVLYRYSNAQNIGYLLSLTEKEAKTNEGYDFKKIQGIAQEAIINALTEISSDIIDDFIENNYKSDIQEYLSQYDEEEDILVSGAYDDIIDDIIDEVRGFCDVACDVAMNDFLKKYKIYHIDLSEIDIDYNNYIYDFIEKQVEELFV